MTARLRIWDLHCHISAAGRTPTERMAELMRYADRMQIERVCIYMGYPHTMNPSPERLREENDQVLEALEHWHDRAFGFCYVSGEHVEASLREIDRCVRDGPMVGIKLWVSKRCSDPALDPIIRRAAELKAVIFQHTWFKTDGNNGPGESTPDDLVTLAKRHPGVPLICGHSGGTWELGIRTVRPIKQIYVDLAGSDPTAGITEMAVRELGAERVLYGSDAPGRSFASQLSKVTGASIDDAAKELILGGNLRRLMGGILTAKGVRA
jgi:predicted TIM-barrel fold metal-dependent hydrolase